MSQITNFPQGRPPPLDNTNDSTVADTKTPHPQSLKDSFLKDKWVIAQNEKISFNIINQSDPMKEIKAQKFSKEVLTRLDQRVVEKLATKRNFPYISEEELEKIMGFLKDPKNRKALSYLCSIEKEHHRRTLQNTYGNKILCQDEQFDLQKHYVWNMMNEKHLKALSEKEQRKKQEESLGQREVGVNNEASTSSRKELAKSVASLSEASEVCLSLAKHYEWEPSRILFLETSAFFQEGARREETEAFPTEIDFFGIPKSQKLSSQLKRCFLEKKQDLIEKCNLSDEELQEIVKTMQDPQNLQIVKRLQKFLIQQADCSLNSLLAEEPKGMRSFLTQLRKEVSAEISNEVSTASLPLQESEVTASETAKVAVPILGHQNPV